jgi:hypothetical protein
MKKLIFAVTIVCLFCSPAFAQQATAARGTNVRPTASTAQQPVAHLAAGDTVTLLSTTEKNGYLHVKTADATTGWAWAKNLTVGAAAPTPALAAPAAAAVAGGNEASNVPSCPPSGKDKQGTKISPAKNAGLLNLAKRHIPAGSTPTTLKLADFVKLITAAEAEFGIDARSSKFIIEPTRTKLKPLPGTPAPEGDLVQFSGFVNEVRPQHGESVNCYSTTNADIHINVGAKGKTEFDGIVVEMIPQLPRPLGWDNNALVKLRDDQVPVLVVGGLTLDNEHLLNNDSQHVIKSQPARISLWEIHPVTEFFVCEKASCDRENHSDWLTLSKWRQKNPRH